MSINLEDIFDPSDERHKKIAKGMDQARHDTEMKDVRHVLSTRQGRRFFWKYIGECQVFHSAFTGNNTTFYNTGKQAIGLKLMSDLNEATPDSYVLMQSEEAERRAQEKQYFLKELNSGR
jgi:hypothetical protein